MNEQRTSFNIVIWPREEQDASSGLIVGWVSPDRKSDRPWPYNAFVCAGIIQIENDHESLTTAIKRINSRIRHQREITYKNQQEDCIERTCWAEFQVIGLWKLESAAKGFPHFDSVDSIPTLIQTSGLKSQVVETLFYRHRSIYRHPDSDGSSFFSNILLTRLSHAHLLLAVVLKEKDMVSPASEKARAYGTGKPVEKLPDMLVDALPFIQHCRKVKGQVFPFASFVRCLRQCPEKCLSVYSKSSSRLEKYNTCSRLLLDGFCGIVVGTLLGHLATKDYSRIFCIEMSQNYLDALVGGVEWLGRNPVGFKLNQPLTEALGTQLVYSFRVYSAILQSLLRSSLSFKILSYLLPLTGTLIGMTGLISLFQSLLHMMTLQLFLASEVFRRIYSGEIRILAALWRVFRGKKLNVLRQRTDHMEYDSMQLLFGTILFTISLFLFTTIFVHHAFFSSLGFMAGIANALLSTVYHLLSTSPLGHFAMEMFSPNSLSEGVYLVQPFPSQAYVYQLAMKKKSPISLVATFLSSAVAGLFRWIAQQPLLILQGRRRRL